jgi:hypothetical protein
MRERTTVGARWPGLRQDPPGPQHNKETRRQKDKRRSTIRACFRLRQLHVSLSPCLPVLSPPVRCVSNRALVAIAILLATTGCDMLDMYDEPRFEPLEASTFFDDGTSARPLVAGTVARGELRDDEAFYSGKIDGKYVTELPLELNRELLERGQERFNIYCSPCHGRVGDGNGMIVQRGFRRPPSFVSTDRLLNAPVGHFYDVISNGFGAMPSYASRVDPHDRWAIVAYIRALQRSQNGSVNDVPAELRDDIAESEAVQEEERKKREAAEERDVERQRKLQRDVQEHRRSLEEGERRHEELQREKSGARRTPKRRDKETRVQRDKGNAQAESGPASKPLLVPLSPCPLVMLRTGTAQPHNQPACTDRRFITHVSLSPCPALKRITVGNGGSA